MSILFSILFYLPFILGFIWLIKEIKENYKLCKEKRNIFQSEEVNDEN